jgi:uncharacterized protein YjdB
MAPGFFLRHGDDRPVRGIANGNRPQREATVKAIVDLVLDMFIRRAGSKQRNAPVAWAILIALLGAGCTDGTTGPGASDFKRPTSITLSPNTFIVDEGDSIQFVPHFTGEDVPANRVVWKVEPGYKASISARGLLTGELSGLVTVTASYGELQSTADGAVRPVPALLEPASETTLVGSVGTRLPQKVAVRVLGSGQDPVPGVEVRFAVVRGSGSVSTPRVKTDLDGIAQTSWLLGPQTGVQRVVASVTNLGETKFEAQARAVHSIESVSGDGQSAWTFEPLPAALAVRVLDEAGEPVAGQPVSWSTAEGSGYVAAENALTDAQGRAQARWTLGGLAGGQTATATVDGVEPVHFTAEAEELILSAVVASEETVAFDALADEVTLHAEALDESGSPVPTAALLWTSLDPSIVNVDSMGIVTSKGVGTARVVVSAFCCGVADTVSAQVTQVPARISITPETKLLQVGAQFQFDGTVRDRNGFQIPNAPQTWNSLDPSVATVVAATGKAKAVAPGSARIRASSGELSADATVQVTDQPLPVSAEPAFFDDFESGAHGPSVAGYGHGASNIPVSDENAFGNSRYSLKFVFGPDGPGEDSWSEHRFHFGEQLSAVWLEYQLFVPSNYYHRNDEGPDNNKFIRLWASSGQKFSLTLETRPQADAPGESKFRSFISESGGTAGGLPRGDAEYVIGPESPIRPGQWHQIRVHWHASTDGTQHDGRAEVFVDGELVHSVDRDFWNQSNQPRTYVDRGYLLGWSNSGFTERTEFFIDDFKIFSADPGWQ